MGVPARLSDLSAMKIGIIGHGAIGQYVRGQLATHGITEVARIVRQGKEGEHPLCISDLRDCPNVPT